MNETPATSVEAARKHHAKHGDMDGRTCMLSACALHYPKSQFRESLPDNLQEEYEEICLIKDSDEWLKRYLAWFRNSMAYHSSVASMRSI